MTKLLTADLFVKVDLEFTRLQMEQRFSVGGYATTKKVVSTDIQ